MISVDDVRSSIAGGNVVFAEYLRKSRADSETVTVEEVLSRHEGILKDYMMNTFGITISENRIYKEVVSGETIDDRIEIRKMFSEVEKGNVYAVVCVEPQRLTRGDLVDLGTVERIFKYTNTLIICPNKIYDLNDQFDLKLFRMELQQGSEYLEYSKMILVRGKMRSLQEGKFLGSVAPIGYDRIKLDKGYSLKQNQDAEVVREVFSTFENTHSVHEASKVASQLFSRELSYNSTRRMLSNKVYAGFVTYGKNKHIISVEDGKLKSSRKIVDDYIEVKALHEPIISLEYFNRIQEMMNIYTPHTRIDCTLKNSLSGLIYCGKCGKMMRRGNESASGKAHIMCLTKKCNCVSSSLELVESRLFEALAEELKSENRYLDDYEQEIIIEKKSKKVLVDRLEKEITKLENRLEKIMSAYEDGIYDNETFLARSNTMKSKINSLKTEIRASDFDQTFEKNDVFRKRIPILDKCLKSYSMLTPKERNDLLKTFVSKIEYTKDVRGCRTKLEEAESFVLKVYFIS